jgi:hypothetical protein
MNYKCSLARLSGAAAFLLLSTVSHALVVIDDFVAGAAPSPAALAEDSLLPNPSYIDFFTESHDGGPTIPGAGILQEYLPTSSVVSSRRGLDVHAASGSMAAKLISYGESPGLQLSFTSDYPSDDRFGGTMSLVYIEPRYGERNLNLDLLSGLGTDDYQDILLRLSLSDFVATGSEGATFYVGLDLRSTTTQLYLEKWISVPESGVITWGESDFEAQAAALEGVMSFNEFFSDVDYISLGISSGSLSSGFAEPTGTVTHESVGFTLTGFFATTTSENALLIPSVAAVPEPSTYGLMLGTLLGFVVVRRRKKGGSRHE